MRQPWPSLGGDSQYRVVQRALVQILALMAALGSGKETRSGRGPSMVDSDLKQRCYSIGTCVPEEEPSGEATVVCAIMERSVKCMAAAADACRQLNFSRQLQDIHATAVRELTQELKNHCADVMPGTASSVEPDGMPGTASSAEPDVMPGSASSVEPDVMPGTASSAEPWTVTGRSDEDYVEKSLMEESEGVEITDAELLEDDVKSGVSMTSVCGLLMLMTALSSAILAAESYARVLFSL